MIRASHVLIPAEPSISIAVRNGQGHVPVYHLDLGRMAVLRSAESEEISRAVSRLIVKVVDDLEREILFERKRAKRP